MHFLTNNNLRCPLDGLPLRALDGRLLCDAQHSFDIARAGYCNLLSASDKRSRDPGDSKAMVVARREFLAGGHFRPIADKLLELVIPRLDDASVVVDAGCGEGYYLQQLAQAVSSAGLQSALVGFDISKWAVQAAARRFPATWLVAGNRNIPVADHSVDVLLSLFGFPAYDSFQRVLKSGGGLLIVAAGPEHLIELREVIYPAVKISASRELQRALASGFCLVETATLQYSTAQLGREEISHLLCMTPHLFRATREGKERAAQLDQFAVSVDVNFYLLRQSGAAARSSRRDRAAR